MTLLSDLQSELQAASAAMAHAERTAMSHPDVPSVLATLRTIQVRRRGLEEQFLVAAKEAGLEMCSYRVEFDDRRFATITALTAALSTFQRVFTSVYDALVHGPRKNIRFTDEAQAATSFGFAYTFEGSVGFMMTLPSEQALIGSDKLDEAMERTLQLLNIREPRNVQALAETVGLASIRLAHQWATEHTKFRLGADIEWERRAQPKLRLRIQPQEIALVSDVIGSAITQEQLKIVGELMNVNYSDRTFEMVVDGKKIRGTFGNAINEEKPAGVPRRYTATVTASTKVASMVEGQDETTYFLVSLENPPERGLMTLPSS